jgi:hypothetical protein
VFCSAAAAATRSPRARCARQLAERMPALVWRARARVSFRRLSRGSLRARSPRGAGWLFGAKVTSEFNHINGLELICRAHQLVQEGYKYMFNEDLVTVWSAPNYCYRCGNDACILTIDEQLGRNFKIFKEVESQQQSQQPARGNVPYFL